MFSALMGYLSITFISKMGTFLAWKTVFFLGFSFGLFKKDFGNLKCSTHKSFKNMNNALA